MFNFPIYDMIQKGNFFRGLIACDREKILPLDVLPMFLGLCDFPEVKYTKQICNFEHIEVHQPGELHCCISMTLSLRAQAKLIQLIFFNPCFADPSLRSIMGELAEERVWLLLFAVGSWHFWAHPWHFNITSIAFQLNFNGTSTALQQTFNGPSTELQENFNETSTSFQRHQNRFLKKIPVLLSALFERFSVSRMRDYVYFWQKSSLDKGSWTDQNATYLSNQILIISGLWWPL